MRPSVRELYAQLYDVSVPDWPGEIEFYLELAGKIKSEGREALEIACGTGRVTLRLAKSGVAITGMDLSEEMLEVARSKSAGIPNVHWVRGDMRSFDLGKTFGLVIIPGHSFQNILTPEDQVACLECIKQHLDPHGILVVHLDHQDVSWLGDLLREEKGVFGKWSEVRHPVSGNLVRTAHAWTYEPGTQTASVTTVWEALDEYGRLVDRWERKSLPLHCVFRFEMEHLVRRVGFNIEGVYGDFFKQPLVDDSSQMVWVVKK